MTAVSDVLIIGGGPAGLSATLSLARQLHTVIIFDSGTYRNDPSTLIHLMPTWDHKSLLDFRAAARKDVAKYKNVQLEKTEIVRVQKESGIFRVTDRANKTWLGKKILLASGSEDVFPDIDGYGDCWGRGVVHCLFCDGHDEAGSASCGLLAVERLAKPSMAIHMAHMALQLAKNITIYTDGNTSVSKAISNIPGSAPDWKYDDRKIRRLAMKSEGKMAVDIFFEDGSQATESFIAHSPVTRLRGPFAEQLGLELSEWGDLKVKLPFSETNVSGVFAAGDCTTILKVMTNAIANGSTAGAGIAGRLQEEMYGAAPLW